MQVYITHRRSLAGDVPCDPRQPWPPPLVRALGLSRDLDSEPVRSPNAAAGQSGKSFSL